MHTIIEVFAVITFTALFVFMSRGLLNYSTHLASAVEEHHAGVMPQCLGKNIVLTFWTNCAKSTSQVARTWLTILNITSCL